MDADVPPPSHAGNVLQQFQREQEQQQQQQQQQRQQRQQRQSTVRDVSEKERELEGFPIGADPADGALFAGRSESTARSDSTASVPSLTPRASAVGVRIQHWCVLVCEIVPNACVRSVSNQDLPEHPRIVAQCHFVHDAWVSDCVLCGSYWLAVRLLGTPVPLWTRSTVSNACSATVSRLHGCV